MLTYAGKNLLCPSAEICGWIEALVNPADMLQFEYKEWPGKNLLGIAFPGSTDRRAFRLNTLWWPTGAARWAVGHFLVDDKTLAQIRLEGYGPLPFVMKDDAAPASIPITADLYMLTPRPLANVPGATLDDIWMITLVDERYFWWTTDYSLITVVENVTTWEDVYEQLNVTPGPIDVAYLNPAASVAVTYENAPLVLDSVAYNTGLRVIRQLDGTVTAQHWSEAQESLSDNIAALGAYPPKMAGGEFSLVDVQAQLATSVLVRFPRTDDGSASTGFYAPITDIDGTHTGTKVFHDTACADYQGGILQNGTELDALAAIIALDYYRWNLVQLDTKFAGLINWTIEGQSDAVEWGYNPAIGECSTRIYPCPLDDLTEELQHAGTGVIPSLNTGNGGNLTVENLYVTNNAYVTNNTYVTNIYVSEGTETGTINVLETFAIAWHEYSESNSFNTYNGTDSEIYYTGPSTTISTLTSGVLDGQHLYIYNAGAGTITYDNLGNIVNPSDAASYVQYPNNGVFFKYSQNNNAWYNMYPGVFTATGSHASTGLVPQPPSGFIPGVPAEDDLVLYSSATWAHTVWWEDSRVTHPAYQSNRTTARIVGSGGTTVTVDDNSSLDYALITVTSTAGGSANEDFWKQTGTTIERWYIAGMGDSAFTLSASVISANKLYLFPLRQIQGHTLDRMGIDVLVNSVGKVAKMVIYEVTSTSNLAPAALAVDYTTEIDVGTTGMKEVTIAFTPTDGKMYCLGLVCDGTPTLRGVLSTEMQPWLGVAKTTATTAIGVGWDPALAYPAGSMPDPAPSVASSDIALTSGGAYYGCLMYRLSS